MLAVGDAAFQRKCLAKMQDVARRERTILFVSHNLAAIQQLCTRSLVLDGGRIAFIGDTTEAVNLYLGAGKTPSSFRADAAGRTRYIAEARLASDWEAGASTVEQGDDLVIELTVVNESDPFEAAFGIAILTPDMVGVIGHNTINLGEPVTCPSGRTAVRATVPKLPLMEGTYVISFALHQWRSGTVIDHAPSCLSFDVLPTRGAIPRLNRSGVVVWECDWQLVDGR